MSSYSAGDNILSYIYDLQTDMWTTMPAIVDSFDSTKQTINCTLAVSRKKRDGGVIDAPTLLEVPVLYTGGSDTIFYTPLKKGDMVLVMFTTMNSNEFIAGNGEVTVPPSMRYHDLSDAFAIPGLFIRKKPLRDEALKDVPHIRHKNTTISFADNGDLNISSSGSVNIEASTKVITDTPITEIGGTGGSAIGRVGDSVSVTIPMGSFLVAATAGVLNPDPVVVTGTITTGSPANTST